MLFQDEDDDDQEVDDVPRIAQVSLLAEYEAVCKNLYHGLQDKNNREADVKVVEDLVSRCLIIGVYEVSARHRNAICQDASDNKFVENVMLGDNRCRFSKRITICDAAKCFRHTFYYTVADSKFSCGYTNRFASQLDNLSAGEVLLGER